MVPSVGPEAPASAPSNTQRGRGDSARGGGRGRGRGKGRGRGGGRGDNRRDGQTSNDSPSQNDSRRPNDAISPPKPRTEKLPDNDSASAADPDADSCFICANPVVHYSIAPCNHKTCHICGLRMRALYKTNDCAHCRTRSSFVIFTDDPDKPYEQYTDSEITTTDTNIGIRYANEDIVGDTVLLLRYNCPDPSCDFAGLGWPDLHRHVRSVHKKKMCDLCTRNKKVFTHEHELFQEKELEKHMRHGDDRPGAVDQTGFKGHPLCGFCGERFYDDDKLFEHCRHKHERCFICDRRDSRNPHYYQDYNSLERHFRQDHFICLDRECLAKKFVVFESEMDLKAHQLSEHADSLSKDIRRDARVVDMSSFDFRQSYQTERRGGGRARDNQVRGRDPNAELPPPSSNPPLRRDEIAFQRQLAIHSAQSQTVRSFGGQLTSQPPQQQSQQSQPSTRPERGARENGSNRGTGPLGSAPSEGLLSQPIDTASMSPQDRARLVRHRSVVERASTMLANDATKMTTFKEHVSAYMNGKLGAPQLVDKLFTLFEDSSSSSLGTLVRELAELYEDKNKSDALRKAWQDRRATNEEDYPSLPGLGGMQGATTSSSGWASAAASSISTSGASSHRYTNRVLQLKNSTKQGVPAVRTPIVGSSTWVAPRASRPSSSSTAFPTLAAATGTSSTSTSASRTPTWIGSSTPSGGSTASRTNANKTRGPAPSGTDAFPALPAAPKPLTTIFGYGTGVVRRDIGANHNTGFSWGGDSSSSAAPSANPSDREEESQEGGKKKKGNKGKKQVLVQWG